MLGIGGRETHAAAPAVVAASLSAPHSGHRCCGRSLAERHHRQVYEVTGSTTGQSQSTFKQGDTDRALPRFDGRLQWYHDTEVPSTKNMMLRLDPELARQLEAVAEVEGRPISEVVR